MSKKLSLLIASILLLAQNVSAQDVLSKESSFYNYFGELPLEISIVLILLIFGLFIVLVLLTAVLIDLGRHARKDLITKGQSVPFIVSLFGIFDGDAKALTGEYADVIIDNHDYDGIQEFDNDLPPWWLYGFYITVFIGVAYLLHYHVFKTGDLMIAEYNSEIKTAELLYADVDLVYDKISDDEVKLAEAKIIFAENCATCHGDQAAGSRGADFTAGPNLTDKYWIYGGNINDVYKTIKHGQGNGKMPDWKNKFSNDQIYQIASFVKSLQGSEVNNPKDPQGELFEE